MTIQVAVQRSSPARRDNMIIQSLHHEPGL